MLITSWLRSVQNRLILNRRRAVRRRPERDSGAQSAEKLEDKTLLVAPTLVAVQPNVGEFLSPDEIRNVAPQQITLQFNPGQEIDPATLGAITLTRSVDGTFGNGNDVDVEIGFAGLGDLPEDVVVRFAQNLPDDKYQINISGEAGFGLANTDGELINNGADETFPFELDLGSQVVSIVPQPITRRNNGTLIQARDQIDVYFNDDDLDLASATDPSFYDLIFTNDTATNLDDVTFRPDSVEYSPATDKATLTFSANIHNLGGAGTYRLRIGTDEGTPQAPIETTVLADPGDAFRTADTTIGDLSAVGNTSQILSAGIEAQSYTLDFPGSNSEPGHREIEAERHIILGADDTDGVTTVFYNFQDNYGFLPDGTPLLNLITDAQKQRAREVLELFSTEAGLDFVETDNQGLTIVTGDPAALGFPGDGPGGNLHTWDRNLGIVVLDAAENWNDEIALPADDNPSWFHEAASGIGRLLGLGYSGDLPESTIGGDDPLAGNGADPEPDFVVNADTFHLQHRFRPDSIDIDLYQFEVSDAGLFSAEILAERQANSSNLDSVLRLFDADGELVAQNDDYFSEDSFVELSLEPGTYFIGVSASGNDDYEPIIANTGIGGTSQGAYDLRLDFRPNVDDTLVDATGTAFDGDRDGVAGGVENFWFRAVEPVDQIVVDKNAPDGGTGRVSSPLNQIDVALASASPGDIVRIVGNGGADGDISTIEDNNAYEIGFDVSSTPQPLVDGSTLEVPTGVTTIIDAGAILKLNRARIGVGSPTSSVDNSGAALQVLGIPGTDVILTSWQDESVGNDTSGPPTTPSPGNWGGIAFQNDVDNDEARFNYENEGIFLNYVTHADIQFGGGNVVVNSQSETVNPIHLTEARPTIINNKISQSADSAVSADPDSFEETNFNTPEFQSLTAFTTDYNRVGPDIYGNILTQNSTNGLFIRVETAAGSDPNRLNVAARFDDTDIVHVLTGNLEVAGTPGGAVLDSTSPSVILVTLTESPVGGTLTAGVYNYRLVFVDAAGNESPASDVTRDVVVTGPTSTVLLENLPPATSGFVGRRLYRSDAAAGGTYELVANLDVSDTTFLDDGTTFTQTLDPVAQVQLARLNARLAIDAGTILKLDQARIEVGFGASLIAEGDLGREIIVTSRNDDRFGIGGTFDTNSDDNDLVESEPAPGDFGGIYAGHTSNLSLDRTLVTFGGGTTPLEGTFGSFNAIEIHQANARITNSVFENNADGVGVTGAENRFGRLANASATIFVRGSQPIIVGNIIRDGAGPAISINTNSLNHEFVRDAGRSRGDASFIDSYSDNQGPLIRENVLGRNAINGVEIRGETIATGGVWDDTDIVHVLRSEIYIPDLHTFGGLRLESSPDASLVVKLSGADAGFTANGRPLDITDRIGGSLQIVGQPFRPVVLTSLADDTIGAGFGLDGLPLTDTNSDGNATTPQPGDWRSVLIDQFANDRNVSIIVEGETANELAPDTNGATTVAQFLGQLGEGERDSDENLRLGFSINGSINRAEDVDVYSFSASSGTELFIDLDSTRHALDGVVELLNANGQIIAQSDNSLDELRGNFSVFTGVGDPNANVLSRSVHEGVDYYSTNQRDAGFRVILPGATGSVGTFFVRIRSSNIDSLDPTADRGDLQDTSKLGDGLTSGGYELQIRLREVDEAAGSTVRYGDIRFATNGIEVFGHPSHSPLTGELAEPEGDDGNDTLGTAQDAGNFGNTDRAALAFSGTLSDPADVDFFEFDVQFDSTEDGDPFPDLHMPVIFDLDYADGFSRANTTVSIFDENGELVYIGRDSSIAEDRPAPLNGADVDDLSRGTVGPRDAFIGPVELAVGRYFIAVTASGQIPSVLDPAVTAQTRLEPLTTITRVAEERFGNDAPATSDGPITDLFTTVTEADGTLGLDPSHTNFALSDVSLFVSGSGQTGATTGIYLVDAFTGAVQEHVGQFQQAIGDIAIRPDGELFTHANSVFNGVPNDTTLGHFAHIDTSNGAITDLGDEGPNTFTGDCIPPTVNQANVGLNYTATHFDGTGATAGLAVAENRAVTANPPAEDYYNRNALFNFNYSTGTVINQEALPRLGPALACDGIHTDLFEIGQITAVQDNYIVGLADARDANGSPNSFGDTDLYAIDDQGVLYAVDYVLGTAQAPGRARNVRTQQIRQVIDRPFSGLVNGPRVGTEDGAYEQILFGITEDGEIYAFDTSGNLQPVLADGQSMVSTGIPNPSGLAFGTLDYNLWNVTNNRANDAGHGTTAAPDGSRVATPGGSSLYFGNQAGGLDAGNKNNLGAANGFLPTANAVNDINFPGGAQGDVISNEFSLEGYSSEDKPALYFNYFLETEDLEGTNVSDSLRVYVGGDETFVDPATGEFTSWSLLATNNDVQIAGPGNDELDFGIGNANTNFPDTQSFRNVEPLFDNTNTWLQARVDLSSFAGADSLRLRFVFASSGTLNIGGAATANPAVFPATGGEELYSLPGSDLRDGDQFIIEDNGVQNTFTFDLGYTLITPSGGAITEGDTFTVDGTTFEFDSDGTTSAGFAVPYAPLMTADEIASSVSAAIDQFLAGTVEPSQFGNRINLIGAGTLSQAGSLVIEGSPGAAENPISINSALTREEVAAEMRSVLASVLAGGSPLAIKGTGDQLVLATYNIIDSGPLPAANTLPGDGFGFADSNIGGPSTRGSNNAVEGVYIDDIIIGFAERGELVTNAPNDSTFTADPLGSAGTQVGPYDVEIRRASEFGFSQNAAPSLVLTRSIDTNDRVANQTSLVVPSGGGIGDGETFSISDGTNTVIFEFEDVSAGNGVAAGHQPITFDPFNGATGDEAADLDEELAVRIRDAINSPAVQGIIDVTAGLSDGAATGGGSTSNIVNLYGNVIVDLERPADTFGVVGELNPVSPLNSDDLFTFENLSAGGEGISSISLILPEGSYFDPDPGGVAPNDSGPDGSSGPAVSVNSDAVGQTFTFDLNDLGVRDTVTVLFSNFDAGEVFEFGVDLESSNNPLDYLGTKYIITFDSGRTVAGLFQNTQDVNPLAHDDIIDPARRDFVGVLASQLALIQFDDFGDSNQFRDQGQILIQQNSVTDSAEFGIVADAGDRNPANVPLSGTLPHQGPVRNLQELNTENLVPGVVIENNVVARGGTGGIHFSGDSTTGVLAPVPYGRIINNTVVGDSSGIGILVDDNAGPTILNNIVADLTTGLQVAGDSQANTVVGTTLYSGNGTDADSGAIGLGTFSIVLPGTDPLFIDAANGNYYPAPQSATIDSSLNSLGDRAEIVQVKSPLGISVSPILAPDLDVFGQFRGDDPDVSPPSGLGSSVFKDRGAIDRVDFFRPSAVLANPEDGSVIDLDPDPDEVWINVPDVLRQFVIRLDDEGIGIDDSTVTSAAFKLFQDDVELVDGVDYIFTYNSNTSEAIFTAVTTFEFERFYRIEVDNNGPMEDGIQGIRDLAGNSLRANQADGTTQFFILVTDGVNDPPENSVPADQTLPEDTVFTFSSLSGTGITVSDPDVHLGNNELQVTLTATNGLLTLGGITGLTFTVGDGTDDTTMTFTGDVVDLNIALNGLTLTPTPEFVGDATVTITTEDQGQFSGPPVENESDTDVITLTYFQVNDAPTFDLPGNPPVGVIEDAGLQTVVGFAANMDAGAPNESDQTLTFLVSLTSSTGNLAFTSGPAIDPVTGDLTYETAPHTNGTATFEVVLQDDGPNGGEDVNTSTPLSFTLNVEAINDEPNFELLGDADPPAVDEDAGPQTIPGYITNAVPGPIEATDEVGQEVSLSFQLIGTSGNLEFVSLFIDPVTGDLTYEAAPNTAGSGLVSVTIVDNGTAAPPPHDNEGPTQQFFIVVNSVDDVPVAVTPDYTIDHGDSLVLDATESFDVDIPLGDSLTYSWDLDNDGVFGDAVGATPSIPWSTLIGFGFTPASTNTIQLQVTDEPDGSGNSRTDIAQATVTVIAVDYGDAPNSFGTNRPDGAAHVILPGFHLGSGVDSDIDGQAGGNLQGDDNNGIDDEDGISFPTTIEADTTQALSSPFTVTVTSVFAARLDAWVDFNNDGVFDASEHINGGISYDVFNGTQSLPLTVPAGSALGSLPARFRLSTSGGLTPTGRANEGEVEDHQVTIIAVQPPQVPAFDTTAPGPSTTDLTPTFEWSADPANTSYQFQLFAPDGSLLEDGQNLGVPFFTVANELPFGTYTYRVRAFNRAGTASDWSPFASLDVVPEAVIYETPTGRVPDSTPTFAWTAIEGVEGYTLVVNNQAGDNIITETVTGTFFTSPIELPLGSYVVEVNAFAGGVTGDASQTSIDIVAPPVVTGPESLTFDETPTITWEAPLGAGTFQVRIRKPGDPTNLVNVTGITDNFFTLTEPLPFGDYVVLVRATAASDPTFFSNIDREAFEIVSRPEIIAPGNEITDGSATVQWTAVSGGESYEVRINNVTTGEDNFIAETGIEGLSYQLPNLPVGRYEIEVRGINPFGEESRSDIQSLNVVTRPTGLSPIGSFFDRQPVFTVDTLDGVQDYELRVHKLLSGGTPGTEDGRVNNFIRLVLPNGETSYGSPYETIFGTRIFIPNSGYIAYFRGITSDGLRTRWSEGFQFRVGGQPTLDPVEANGDSTPTFNWTPIPDAVRYIFRIRRVSDNRVVRRETQLFDTTYTLTDPLPSGDYRAWVRAVSADGVLSPFSGSRPFTVTDSAEAFLELDDQPIMVEPESVTLVGPEGIELQQQIELPEVALPVGTVTDPAIEIIEQHDIPMLPEERFIPESEGSSWLPEVEGVDDVLSSSLGWLNDVTAEDIANSEANDVELRATEVAGGVLGGLLGAALLKRRSDKKSRDRRSL